TVRSMGRLSCAACRTLDAYTVQGAWGRGRSHTDRRSFGPGARTETHAGRQGSPEPPPSGPRAEGGGAPFPPAPPPPPRGGGGGGERRPWKRAGTRPELGTRPAA